MHLSLLFLVIPMRPLRSVYSSFRHCLIAITIAGGIAACQTTTPPPTQAIVQEEQQWQQLIRLMDERLAVAPLVARSKWNSGAPIDDPVREQQILQDVAQRVSEAGVEPALATAFFQAQFDAGKLVQRRLHAQWRAQGQAPFAPAPDLAREVRPVLDRLTPQLIAALRALQPALRQPGATERLAAAASAWQSVDEDVRRMALEPLLMQECQNTSTTASTLCRSEHSEESHPVAHK